MSKLVISGYYGFGNAGDEAMLSAMVGALRSLDPAVCIVVISGNPADTRRRHGVEAVHRLNMWSILRALRSSELLVSGGGSLLQDVTSGRSIFYYLGIMKLACFLDKPVMLYAQGIGPIRSSLARSFMRHIGNCLAGATVRDEGSRRELAALGVTKPFVSVTADPVLALSPVKKETGAAFLDALGLKGDGPLIGFSVREWKGHEHYKTVFAAAADRLVAESGARIVFLPMQWPDDLQAARLVASRMKQPCGMLEGRYDTEDLLSIVGALDLLVGIRLHALIFAAVMNTPFVGVSYDPKIDSFLETFGARHAGTLSTITTDGLLAEIAQTCRDGEAAERRRLRVAELREQALANAAHAMDLIQNRGKVSSLSNNNKVN